MFQYVINFLRQLAERICLIMTQIFVSVWDNEHFGLYLFLILHDCPQFFLSRLR
jgi:hypothetical protein